MNPVHNLTPRFSNTRFYYYIHINAYVSQVVIYFKVIRLKFCMHFSRVLLTSPL
jgi:hypothetical protein